MSWYAGAGHLADEADCRPAMGWEVIGSISESARLTYSGRDLDCIWVNQTRQKDACWAKEAWLATYSAFRSQVYLLWARLRRYIARHERRHPTPRS